MLSAILLAAGSSRRMGSVNKLLLPWQDHTLVFATAQNLLAAGIQDLIVVTGHDPEAVTAALATLPVRTIHNPAHATGMTSSIQTGVRIAEGKGYMICLADMVLITPAEYTLLKTAFLRQHLLDDRCIILPEYQGENGNPVIFSSWYRNALLQHPEKEGCKTLVHDHTDHHLRVAMPADHVLRDIDRPEQYADLIHRST